MATIKDLIKANLVSVLFIDLKLSISFNEIVSNELNNLIN